LLFAANWQDNPKVLYEGKFVTIKRGEFVTTHKYLINELPGCTSKRLRLFLDLLVTSNTIEMKKGTKGTHVIILNYDSYQSENLEKGKRRANEGQTKGTNRTKITKITSNIANNSQNLKKKEFAFKEIVFAQTGYEKETLKTFFEYWSEPNKSKTQLRYEIEKTWDISRRLKRWGANQFSGTSKQSSEQKPVFISKIN
jgi:hypothetical protein